MAETDEEQIEALKKWWSENGRAIIVGVVLGAGVIVGWRYWESQQVAHSQSASTAYHSILTQYDQGEATLVNENAYAMREEYSGTPYAALAALLQAKLAIGDNKLDEAADALRWANDNSPEEDVRIIASLRLARVLNTQGQYDEALEIINSSFPQAYTSLVEEAKGDILLAKGAPDLAREAYQRALTADQLAGGTTLLQMKIDDLAKPADDTQS